VELCRPLELSGGSFVTAVRLGIGRAIAQALAVQGAAVAVSTSPEGGKETVAAIATKAGARRFVQGDVTAGTTSIENGGGGARGRSPRDHGQRGRVLDGYASAEGSPRALERVIGTTSPGRSSAASGARRDAPRARTYHQHRLGRGLVAPAGARRTPVEARRWSSDAALAITYAARASR